MNIVPRGTTAQKIQRIQSMQGKSFAFRLAAILASDSRKGQSWGVKVL